MMNIGSSQAILIVDDSEDDYDVTLRALKRGHALKNPVYRCEDGEEALEFLFRKGRYSNPEDAPRPGIIMLDLNMPGVDGRQVLREIKNDESLKSIPVLIMTTPTTSATSRTVTSWGASTYIQKPLDLVRLHGSDAAPQGILDGDRHPGERVAESGRRFSAFLRTACPNMARRLPGYRRLQAKPRGFAPVSSFEGAAALRSHPRRAVGETTEPIRRLFAKS